MWERKVTRPELILIAGTRVALGLGVGLLLAGRLSRDQRKAATDIKRQHQIAPAPMVAKPSGRQREQAKGDEGSGRERDQARIGTAVNRRQLDDHGRINQDDEVIERMRPIEETDHEPTRPFARNAVLIASCS